MKKERSYLYSERRLKCLIADAASKIYIINSIFREEREEDDTWTLESIHKNLKEWVEELEKNKKLDTIGSGGYFVERDNIDGEHYDYSFHWDVSIGSEVSYNLF